MVRHKRLTTAFAVLLFASPLAAQGIQPANEVPDSASVASPALSLAPTVSNAAVGIRTASAPAPAAPAPFQGSQGRNPAMMIVGGVALLVGAVVGGDSGTIIMIGGGVLGLYGLWQYLK